LVDHRVVVLRPGAPVVAPVEVRVDHDGGHRVRRRVQVVAPSGVVEVVAVDLLTPLDRPADRTGVRVEEQFRGVAAQPPLGCVRPVHTEAVALPGHDPGQVRVPHERVALPQLDRRLGAVVVQQTQLYSVRGLREDREIGAGAVVGGTEWIRFARPDLHEYDSFRCTAPMAAPGSESPRVSFENEGTAATCRTGPQTYAHSGPARASPGRRRPAGYHPPHTRTPGARVTQGAAVPGARVPL